MVKPMKKYEKEIREILEKMDSFVPEAPPQEKEREREPKKKPTNIGILHPVPPRPIRAKQSFGTRFRNWLRTNNITGSLAYLVGGFALMIAGLIILENFRGITIVAQLLVLAGFICYIAPIFIRFFGGDPDRGSSPKYWRGMEVEHESVFTWKKFKGLFTGKRGRDKNDPWNNRNNRW
jgi:hypothetical protein